MNVFDSNLRGKKIAKIYRIDEFDKYDYDNPLGIFLMFNNENGLLIRLGSSKNQREKTLDVRFTSYNEMYELSGAVWSECDINELRQNDNLSFLVGENIENIEILGIENESLTGENFIIKNEILSIDINTKNYRFTFNGNNNPILSIDEIN